MSELALRLIEENKKTKATFLDLGNCGLTEVPEEIGELVWLESIAFSMDWRVWDGNRSYQIRSSNQGELNEIGQLPDSFANLINLKNIWLSGYPNISDLNDLTSLDRLERLQILDISRTKVGNLEPLAGLLAIQTLNISNTQVTNLAPILQLIKKGIPVRWETMSMESKGIYAGGCNLKNPPPDFAFQGNAAILRYFAEKDRLEVWERTLRQHDKAKSKIVFQDFVKIQRSSTIKVREAKLLLVGQGKAGKTTLRKKLQDPNADMPAPGDTTRGIEITRLNEKMPQTGEPLRINVWDFGGQDIQHYAHQFFLTGSSLYALVTNERIQDSVHLPYWLNIIEMLGKKSPVLLIQNKDGGHCQPLRDEAAIRARFGNVHNRVFQTDFSQAATEYEFDELRQEIVHQAALLPHVERDYLVSFVELRGKLEAEADRLTHYLRWEVYLALMPELSEDLLRDYANALTSLGVCQFFPNDAMLSQFVFLRPKWIIDALFTLLLHPLLETKRGHFNEMDTFQIWQDTEYNGMHSHLVRMMEEFELCYRVEGGNHTYILPQRLPSESKTYGWNEPGDTPVQYRYKFMPKGILTRLICRLHERIENDPALGQRVWCDAVIFSLPNGKGRVFAREVYSENTIELRATGDKRAEMLNEVIRKMDDINCDAKYDNLQVDKLVPCPCEVCQTGEKKHFFDFQLLVDLLEEGETEERCHVSRRKQNINEVLRFSGVEYRLRYGLVSPETPAGAGLFRPTPLAETRATSLRIFISYSHAQRDYFQIFKSDFIQYARLPGLDIEVFSDDGIPIGAAWDEFLQTKVAGCNVMILLVSQEFMNSTYIQEREFDAALERLKAKRALLIAPIYFAPCLFHSAEELASLQFFKPHGKEFDEALKGDDFSYIDLVKFNQKDSQPILNSNRQHYMMKLMKKLEPELRKPALKSAP